MKFIATVVLIILALVSVQLVLNYTLLSQRELQKQPTSFQSTDALPEIEVYLVTADSTWRHRTNETMWGPAMHRLEIGQTPLIENDEIVNYYWDTHEIELTAAGYRKIPTRISATGIDFVITVDDHRVYAGTFGTSRSSDGLSWPTILVNELMPAPDETSPNDDKTFRVKIDRNYHGIDDYDHRNNRFLEKALADSKRLVK